MAEGSRSRGRTWTDPREMPVSVIRHDDIDRIAGLFDGRKLPIARSVYFAIVQLVAESVGAYAEETRKDLAAVAGVGVRTLDETVQALEAAGLLHRVQRREDGINLPNLWGLGTLTGDGAADDTRGASCTSAAADTQHSSSSRPRGSGDERTSAFRAALGLDAGVTVSDDLRSDAEELLRKKTKVASRIVTPEEMALAATIVEAYNRIADARFGLGSQLTAIVGRIRERPSYDAPAHVRLIESAFRLKWWERLPGRRGGRPTPAVIYGNARVFEQVVQDAIDEKQGRPVQDSPERRKRFTRED